MQTVDSAKLAQAKFSFNQVLNSLFFYLKSLCFYLNGEEHVRKEMQTVSEGIRVSTLSQIVHLNNGLSTYSQFSEVVNRVENFVPTAKTIFVKATSFYILIFRIVTCKKRN